MIIIVDRCDHNSRRIINDKHLAVIHRAADIVNFNAVSVRIEFIYRSGCCRIRILSVLLCGHGIYQSRIGYLGKSLGLIAVHDSFDLFIGKDHLR